MYGAGSQEALDFTLTVYHLASQIPRGMVTSYGHLAMLAGKAGNSRQVGYAFKHLSTDPNAVYNTENTPWWRVISASGHISNLRWREHHREVLRQELPVTDDGRVDLHTYGWFPEEPEELDQLDFDFRVPPEPAAVNY